MNDFSLLWPQDKNPTSEKTATRLGKDSARDLELEKTVASISFGQDQRKDVTNILFNLCTDPAVIRYRQDVLEDLLCHPTLKTCFDDLLPKIAAINGYLEKQAAAIVKEKAGLFQVVMRMNELNLYVESVTMLGAAFDGLSDGLHAEGLMRLRDFIAEVRRDEEFLNLVRELPGLLSEIQTHSSVTIGINLDSEMRPCQATLVSVNSEKYSASRLLTKLLGSEKDEWEGMAYLHSIGGQAISSGGPIDPMMVPLFRDLENVLSKVSTSIDQVLSHYIGIDTRLLVSLKEELVFYLAAVRMIEGVVASGLPMCKPKLIPADERVFEVKDNYNINLALHLIDEGGQTDLRNIVIQNDVAFNARGRIIILTGPNSGGKTTYVQAVGLSQVLAQAGLYVPGREARISPVDGIYTHYPIEENLERGTGRFGDEARRLNEVFTHATRYSLVLLNESMSSTSPGESLYLAQDIVRVLQKMGARAVFVTHLHELAAGLDELNSETPGELVVSMVASFVEEKSGDGDPKAAIKRTYKVALGPPMGHSCAKEIATRYSISYEQLMEMLAKRGVV